MVGPDHCWSAVGGLQVRSCVHVETLTNKEDR